MDIATRIGKVREAIRAEALVELLHDHAFGKVELSPTELRAIEVLLRKAVPDLMHQVLHVPRLDNFRVIITEPEVPPPGPDLPSA
jgi:hypothetical protein